MSIPRYEQRGVSASKPDVHRAIGQLDPGLFPGAFCKIVPDHLTGDPEYCLLQHADGAGTKSSLAYLVWKLTGNLDVWKGIVRDSLFMNIDDAICVGALGPFLVSLTIARNKALIPGEVIEVLIGTCQELCELLTVHGIPCHFTGGETADLGDLVRTIVVDNTITTRMKRDRVIDAGRVTAPAYIVGFSTLGQSPWETGPNAGMGSNGLTNARHDVLCPDYRVHIETYAPETDPELIYCGDYGLYEPLPGDERFTVATALLSSTRTYAPTVKCILEYVGHERVLGIFNCSGGGQTKIGKFGQRGITYVKDHLSVIPPLFKLLQQARHLSWREMFETYNVTHRLEMVVSSLTVAEACMAIATGDGIEAQVVGNVVGSTNEGNNRTVVITTPSGEEVYDF